MRWRIVIRSLSMLLLVAGLSAAAWTQRQRWEKPATPEGPSHAVAAPPEIQSVKLSDEAVQGLALRSAEVKLEDYPRVIEVPGVIIDAPGRSPRAVSSPVAGVVTRIFTSPGEAIRPGSPLFTIQLASEFVQSTQTDLARYAKDLIAANLRREQTAKLVAAGTKPGLDLIEDENQVRRLTTQVEGHRRQLAVFGLDAKDIKRAEAGDAVTEITISAPVNEATASGMGLMASDPNVFTFELESLAVAPGQGVTGGQLLARLADYRELLIEGRAFETESSLVADATGEGKPVGVDFLEPTKSGQDSEVKLVIRSIGKTDPASRTFPFYATLANEAKPYERGGKTYLAWKYRAGRQVRLRVPMGTIPNVIVLPAAALVREGADTYVFRQNGETFTRKAVVVVAEDRLNVAITPGNGIEAGVYVLRNNAAAVNRALKALQARGMGGMAGKKGHWHADGSFHEADD